MIAISRKTVFAVASIGAMALGTVLTSGAATAAETKVVELTQVACQFVESENGIDRAFATTKKADCEAINGDTRPVSAR